MLFILVGALVPVCLATDPQPCCTMETYSAVLVSVSGSMQVGSTRGQMADSVMEMHYDYNRSMVVSIIHQKDPVTGIRGNVTVIYDFASNKQHILPEPGRCFTQHLDSNSLPPPCMAKNLTFSGSYLVGSGLKRVRVNSFTGHYGPYQATISLSDKDCTPIAYSQYGSDGKSISLQSFLFTSIKNEISDYGVFNIPPECLSAAPIGSKRGLNPQTLSFERTPFYIFSHQCMMHGYDFQ